MKAKEIKKPFNVMLSPSVVKKSKALIKKSKVSYSFSQLVNGLLNKWNS
jgi:hypothetical protein